MARLPLARPTDAPPIAHAPDEPGPPIPDQADRPAPEPLVPVE